MDNYQYGPLSTIRFPIVMRFYKTHYPAGKPKKDEIIWTAEGAKGLSASVRFRQFEHFQLLTGMLVTPELRGQGLGKKLLFACRSQVETKKCYCLAFRYLVPLYNQSGFETVAPDMLPEELCGRYHSYCQSGKDLVPMLYRTDNTQTGTCNVSETVE